ncbi:MAG TPA: dihydrolipoyl dehydrogenase [Myxococcales bacterium]|mgnify:CR=1 FL=1|nr:dihydrolipoyl dehydrogenase [Myxococcales bacterium]HAN30885.1 dihydrolipoyl dehydrogenase [Myxococcales bacterium]
MSDQHHFDVVVIGAGPGGYVAAIRAAQLGLKTACVEKETRLGGTCLRVGCIPSKALLESSERYIQAKDHLAEHGVDVKGVKLDLAKMMARKDGIVSNLTEGIGFLFQKNKVTRFEGVGSLTPAEGAHGVDVTAQDGSVVSLRARNVIIATGSEVATLPGIDLDGDRIGGSTEALAWSSVPKHLVVIGAGVIGLELGSVWARLGSQVTVLEYADGPLLGMDEELRKRAKRIFKKQGLKMRFGVRVTGVKALKSSCKVEVEGGEPIKCDRVLLAVGRRAHTAGLGLESVGLATDKRGRVEVNAHLETAVSGIYAVGDVIAGPMLAHKAEEEGVAAAEYIATGYGHVDYNAIPGVVYTEPEIAAVGQTEEQLKAAGVPYRKGNFPFAANGRAKALAATDGFIKILAHAETDRVLGVHMIGPRVGELIIEAAMAMSFSASSEDMARVCHAHPTLHEAVKEAALAVDGRALHS